MVVKPPPPARLGEVAKLALWWGRDRATPDWNLRSAPMHVVPGRIRLKVPSLQRNPARGEQARRLLEQEFGASVESHPLTGSLVIHHPGQLTSEAVMVVLSRHGFLAEATPAPCLNRPVLLVHGYASDESAWEGMDQWLQSNPANRPGGIVSQAHEVAPGAIYRMHFTTPFNSLQRNAQELAGVVESICQANHCDEIDLVTHSKGGLDARQYLTDYPERVHHLIMFTPPNQGSALAEWGWGEAHRPALSELAPDNPHLRALNAQLPQQMQKAEMFILTASGVPTPGAAEQGDGVVPLSSQRLPGVPWRNFPDTFHTDITEDPRAHRQAAAFLMDLSPIPD